MILAAHPGQPLERWDLLIILLTAYAVIVARGTAA